MQCFQEFEKFLYLSISLNFLFKIWKIQSMYQHKIALKEKTDTYLKSNLNVIWFQCNSRKLSSLLASSTGYFYWDWHNYPSIKPKFDNYVTVIWFTNTFCLSNYLRKKIMFTNPTTIIYGILVLLEKYCVDLIKNILNC